MERIDILKAFVEKEKNVIKWLHYKENIDKHKWYIRNSLSSMKKEMLKELDDMLKDKRFTLMRQYNNHNDSLRREIRELEDERNEIYNFKFNDGAIMKNAKVKSFLAQEFRDLKARLSKKSFKDGKPKSQREVWLTGLSSIKDSLKRFKDGGPDFSNNIIFTEYYRNGNVRRSTYNTMSIAKDVFNTSKNFGSHTLKRITLTKGSSYGDLISEHTFSDSVIKDFVVSRINEGNIEILINNNGETLGYTLRKKGGVDKLAEKYGFSNTYEAEQAGIKAAKKFNDSAEYINDRKIDIKKDGKLIDVVNAETLDEAVRIYERQHPELKGQIDAYFSDGKVKDARSDMMEELGEQYDMGVQSKRKLVKVLMKEYNVSESQARQTVERFARDLKEMDLPIRDSLSEKAKQLISKAVAEARFDYKTAMDFAVADLKAEKEWAWTNHNEVSQMVQRLIKNRMDF